MKYVRVNRKLRAIREKVSRMFCCIAGGIKGGRAKRVEEEIREEIREGEEFVWVDSAKVCRYYRISRHALQCMRAKGAIGYTIFSGKIYYTLADVRRAFKK